MSALLSLFCCSSLVRTGLPSSACSLSGIIILSGTENRESIVSKLILELFFFSTTSCSLLNLSGVELPLLSLPTVLTFSSDLLDSFLASNFLLVSSTPGLSSLPDVCLTLELAFGMKTFFFSLPHGLLLLLLGLG